ncbi:MAG: hydrogenase maturation protease [Acidimicrobiales bacterium]|nr:hydrogenase maturation protease [Acidimicrobiales bacterium]
MSPDSMSPGRAPDVVIGIGNPLRRDDGIGPALLAALHDRLPPTVDRIELDGEATRLIEAWSDRRRAVVLDAVCMGAAAGTVHDLRIDPREPEGTPAVGTPSVSSHHPGLAAAIELGRAFDRLPRSLRVIGIEPEDLDHGAGLSASVDGSCAAAIDLVIEALA